MSKTPVANRSSRLRRLAGTLGEKYQLDWSRGEHIEPEYDDARREWTYRWTDGPTVEQIRRAARKADREATDGLVYRRELSQQTVALGAIRLAMDPATGVDFRDRPSITPSAVAELWRTVSKPHPRDARETAMVTAILAEANGDRGRNWAQDYDICKLVQEQGLATFLRRAGVELSPIERLTERYAPPRASLAWSHRLVPMTALEAFSAVQANPTARADAVADALTLLPTLHAELDQAAAELQSRVTGEGAAS
ncbi:hypothetical protein HUT19_41550 (plasmid) [Streptomyces sp. NA02950]|uniref:hypothetical protein n=1 Tax=Streptomyces sp. NA02950 TaxID=2742137 RepID=UPI001592657E|nr:hypothetical protein [Streptomyces sp. NA02950]QKV98210.1 hypothetical protein HUT19_41550 [Streptomyces sp. NA02950]